MNYSVTYTNDIPDLSDSPVNFPYIRTALPEGGIATFPAVLLTDIQLAEIDSSPEADTFRVWLAARRPEITKQQALDQCRAARAARYDAEASVYDLADAETKMASPDPAEQAAGVAQKAAVLAKRLAIKAAIPKPI